MEKIEQIHAAKQRGGGKRKPKYVTPYGGDKKEDALVRNQQIKVRLLHEKKSKFLKSSEVVVSHMSSFEIDLYFANKYSERHLKHERDRVLRDFKWRQKSIKG